MKIQGSHVTFEWKGEGKEILIGGDFNNYKYERLTKIGNNYWTIDKILPENGRFDYVFLVDGKQKLDPLNPFTQEGGFGVKSELKMLQFSYPEYVYENPETPRGKLTSKLLKDTFYGHDRKIYFYTPIKEEKDSSILVFQDGPDYINYGLATNILNNLIFKGAILPFYAVFVPVRKETRRQEYTRYKKYAIFLKEFVIETSKNVFGRDFKNVYLVGASLGGNVSLGALTVFPSVFRGVISQSGAFFIKFRNLQSLEGQKIYLSSGLYETSIAGRLNILSSNRRLKEVLSKSPVKLMYREFNDGHSYGNWKAHLGEALEFLCKEE